MNKVFKVVWSKAKNCYVVASELAKRRTKAPKSNIISRTVVAGVLACALSSNFVMPVFAGGSEYDIDTNIEFYDSGGSGRGGSGYVAAGGKLIKTYDSPDNRYFEGADGPCDGTFSGIAIGSGYDSIFRVPENEDYVPSYHTPTAAASQAIAIGNEAFAGGTFSVVLGSQTSSWANRGVAIGHGVSVGNNTFGTVVIGSEINIADGVIGSIVLGHGSYTNQSNVLSIGSNSNKRRIVNVANGTSATDVATVGQIQTVSAGTNVSINTTTNANGSTNKQIVVNGTGTVTKNNTGLINGNAAYNELRPADNGNYVMKDNTTAANLTALDKQTKKNTDGLASEKSARENADSDLSNRIGTLSADGNYIKKDNNASQNLKALDDKIGAASVANGTFAKTANTVNANIKALDTAAANAIKGMTANGKTITYTKGDGTTGTVVINGTGTVSSGNTELINGGTAYTELRPANGTYVKQANTTAANLTALDKQMKANTDGLAAEITNRTNALNNEKTARENADTALSNRIGTLSADGSYIKKDNNASQNLKALDDKIGVASVANGTFAKTANTVNANIKALDTAAANAIKGMTASGKTITYTKGDGTTGTVAVNGTGTVSSGNTELINGGTAYTELRPADGNYVKRASTTAANLTALDTQAKKNADAIATNKSESDAALARKANVGMDNINDAGKAVIRNLAKESVKTTAGTNVSITEGTSGNAKTYQVNVVGNGTVTSGNTGLISGGTAYTELRPADGTYVKQANTTAANLTALDKQMKTNTDGLAAEITNRTNADTALSNRIGTLSADGNYIKKDNNASQNLKALDDKIGAASVANGTYIKTGNTVNANLKALDTQTKANTDAIVAEASAREAADTALSNRIGTLSADGNYIKKDNSSAQNLQALDDKIGAASVANGTYIKSENTVNANLKALDTQLKSGTNALDEKKANKDASNVAEYAQEWADAIGTGTVTADDTKLVTGKTVYDALHDPNMDISVRNVTVNKNLTVLGKTELKDTYIDGTLEVVKEATFHDNVTMEKDLRVDGNGSFGGDLDIEGNGHFGKDLVVDGTSTLKGDVYMNSNAEIGKNLTVKGDSDLQGNAHVGKDLTVDGNGEFGKDLHVVGESRLDGTVTMGSDASVAGNFSVAGNTELKDTLIDGTLEVNKEATFHDNVAMDKDLAVAGNASIGKDLVVEGTSTLKGNTTIGTEDAPADLLVNGNATVTGDSNLQGNASIGKDLTVEGTSTLKGDVTAESNMTVKGDSDLQGNADIGKDLHVKGQSQLDGNTTIGTEDAPADLLVNGNATVKGDTSMEGNASIGKDLTVEGTSTLKGDVSMESNAEIGKDLHVVGTSTLDGDVTAGSNMTVKGDTFLEGNADIGENLHVKGTSQLDGNTTIGTEEAPADLYVTGNSNIGKNLTVQGTLDVMDNTHLHKDLQVDGNTNIGGDIHIGGNQTVDGDSNVKGNQLVEKNLTVNGDTNIAGNTVIQQNLTVDGDSNIKGNETIEKNLSVGGDTNIAGNTNIHKNLTVDGDSNIKGSQLIEKDLTVNGNSIAHGNGRVDKDFSVGGNSDFEGNVHMRKDLKVDGNASIGGTLTADRMVVGGRDVNREFGRMDNRIDSVGANAAALAGLHVPQYEEGQKWNIAAAYGNYKGENAGAIGLFYRPDNRTTLSVGGSFGNDDGMLNVGVSYALQKGVGTSKSALQQEVKDLKAKLKDYDAMKQTVADMQKQLASLSLITNQKASFPDVPADHWANNAVETLHGNNMIQGYPDGQFKGDKPMTRYEYAEMLFNALSKGGNVNKSHVKEYAPELRQIAQKTGRTDVLKGYNIVR